MELVTEPDTPVAGRRRFLAGAGVGAAALAAALSTPSRALAQAEGGEEGDGQATEPVEPTEPTEPDHLAFAESVELAVADAEAAIAAKVGGDAGARLTEYAAHHRAHAAELAKGAGAKAKGNANPGMSLVLADQIELAATSAELLDIAIDLENTLAATHLSLSRLVETAPAQELVAAILPVEAAHAASLGIVDGRSGAALFPDGGEADPENSFETQRKAVDPSVFPVEPAAEGEGGPEGEEEGQ